MSRNDKSERRITKPDPATVGLMSAVIMSDAGVAEGHMKNGANVNFKDKEGNSLLHIAAAKEDINSLAVASLLMQKGINLYEKDAAGKTALEIALDNKTAIGEMLAGKILASYSPEEKKEFLLKALGSDNKQHIQIALDAGADQSIMNKENSMNALPASNMEMKIPNTVIISPPPSQLTSETKAKQAHDLREAETKDRARIETEFLEKVRRGDYNAIKKILEEGSMALVTRAKDMNGNSAYHIVVNSNLETEAKVATIGLLRQHDQGHSTISFDQNNAGNNPLHAAIKKGDAKVV